jgi:hexosaminidase
MIFPRLTALSEVMWSPASSRNWADFEKRMAVQLKRYDLWGVHYNRAYLTDKGEAAKKVAAK